MIRTFVAVELEPALKQAIGRAQEQVKELIRGELRGASSARLQWVRPESVHLTLKFLGDVEERQIETICQAVAQSVSGVAPFSVTAQGIGVFPDFRAPRVLWVGLSPGQDQTEEQQPLPRLAAEVDTALHRLGFPLDTRPFNPHLTLARIKERPHEIGKALHESRLEAFVTPLGGILVGKVALMQSTLTPSGSVYTRLCESRLRG